MLVNRRAVEYPQNRYTAVHQLNSRRAGGRRLKSVESSQELYKQLDAYLRSGHPRSHTVVTPCDRQAWQRVELPQP